MIDQRVAIITGAGRGIGLGIAKRMAAEGYAVALWDIDPARVEEEAKALAASGVLAIPATVDVADSGQVREAGGAVISAGGGSTS